MVVVEGEEARDRCVTLFVTNGNVVQLFIWLPNNTTTRRKAILKVAISQLFVTLCIK